MPADDSTTSGTTMPSTMKMIVSGGQFMFSPPSPFDFSQPLAWERWIQRFERYREVSGLCDTPETKQVTTLLYCMGEDAEDILLASKLTEAERKQYPDVKNMFTNHFIGKRNVIYERAKFNLRVQQENESIESFATDLRKLGEHCQYGALLDEFIRDRIVIGIRDKSFSEKLQLDAELTLESALTKCRQKEAVRRQQAELQNGSNTDKTKLPLSAVDRINQRRNKSSSNSTGQFRPNSGSFKSENSDGKQILNPKTNCWNCGKSKHPFDQCPAKNVRCYTCDKTGHFSRFCKQGSKQNQSKSRPGRKAKIDRVHEFNTNQFAFLGEVRGKKNDRKDKYRVEFNVNGRDINFKMDNGADVTTIPYRMMPPNQRLVSSDRTLLTTDGNRLKVRGMFTATLSTRNNSIREKIYVVEKQHTPLLGKPALEGLDLIRVNHVDNIHASDIKSKYPKLFNGIGKLNGKYKIEIDENAKPFSLNVARNIPIPMKAKVRAELNRMQRLGIIKKITDHTEWCAPMVVTSKSSGEIRICADLSELNKWVKRPRMILPDVDSTLGSIGASKIFSKLDALSGFWQIELDKETAKLTTFITPFGRFYYQRLPFGISSAPEYFQLRMQDILEGLEGVVCLMDDVFVHGANQAEHDKRLDAVLKRLLAAGLVLNEKKCIFSTNCVKFLGHIIDQENVRPDPERIRVLEEFPPPKDISEVRRFNGLVNQLSKFIPRLADKMKPIRELMCKNIKFEWGPAQQKALDEIVSEIKREVELVRYDLNAEVIVSADSSAFGLGAVLFQKSANQLIKPVFFASRVLSSAEQRYAQIEKEALAITWACEKFDPYLRGRGFSIETDHKPLVPLLSTKQLNDIPPRIQRFKMRLMRYSFRIFHTAGKELYTADCLSRIRLPEAGEESSELTKEVEAHVNEIVVPSFPASPGKLKAIEESQRRDPECQEIRQFVNKGWPKFINQVPNFIRQWYPHRAEISVINNLLCKGHRIIIPREMRSEMLTRIHDGHLGIVRCLERAKSSVFWPGISADVNRAVERCYLCIKFRSPPTHPMIATETPLGPWVKVGVDFFELKKTKFLILVDYYSRYIEVAYVKTLTVEEAIVKCKAFFARHGIPHEVMTDSAPQFVNSRAWQRFADEYGFNTPSSSPHFHQSNGEVERAVKTIKQLLMKNSDDPFLALLSYRATRNASGFSPAELLMGRKIRTRLPTLPGATQPEFVDHDGFITWDNDNRQRQAANYNRRHRVTEETNLEVGDKVYIPDRGTDGIVSAKTDFPRSVMVKTSNDEELRRNTTMLRVVDQPDQLSPGQLDKSSPKLPETIVSKPGEVSEAPKTHSRYGRAYRKPDRFQAS